MTVLESPATPAGRPAELRADTVGRLPGLAASAAEPRHAGAMRSAFKTINRWLTVPALNAGLGPWIGTPVGGWILLLRVRGRRSGILRSVPLSYLVADGSVWIAAGFGRKSDWCLNLLADPAVEVVLPGRTLACVAEEVADEQRRALIVPQLVRAMGSPAFLGGINPWRATDAEMLAAMDGVPLIRLRPTAEPILAGPDDPGGSGWIWRQAVVAWLTLSVVRRLLHRR